MHRLPSAARGAGRILAAAVAVLLCTALSVGPARAAGEPDHHDGDERHEHKRDHKDGEKHEHKDGDNHAHGSHVL
jgi:hypothetical protein